MKNYFKFLTILLISIVSIFMITGCEKENPLTNETETIDVQTKIENRITELVEGATDDKKLQDEMREELRFLVEYNVVQIFTLRIDYNSISQDFEYINADQRTTRAWARESMEYEQRTPVSIRTHRRAQYLVTSGTKTVYVHTSVPSGWSTAVSQAISAWNSLGLTVSFTNGGSTSSKYNYGAITVFMHDLTGAYADALSPYSSGNPGGELRIDYGNDGLSSGQKKLIMAHELGHTIGFKHTNTSEGYPLPIASYPCISYVCDGYDASSIMKSGGTPPSSWINFSTCDQQVFQCVYWSLLV